MAGLGLVALCCLAALAGQPSAGSNDVYVVPFSHLDLFWAGSREECLSRGSFIITKAVRIAAQHPEFRFLLEDEVFVADYVEAHRGAPELDELKRLVKAGRIEIGPKWAGILQNLPRGESRVRNQIYGKLYAREVFGVDPQVAHLGDLPGYTSQFPQILAKSDTPFLVQTRMGPPDCSLFRWRSPDGSTALAWNAIKRYSWGTFLTSKTTSDERKQQRIQRDGDIVLRVFEMEGTPAQTPVEFLGRKGAFRAINLLEEDGRSGDQETLRVNPYEISTVRLASFPFEPSRNR